MAATRPKHVIICGMSRSGTSLLYTLLANALPGFTFLDKETSAVSVTGIDRPLLTKRPLDCMLLEHIYELNDRDVKVLFCIRDPRDVICSVHKNVPHDYFIGFKNQYFVVPDKGICQPTNPGLLQIVTQYSSFNGSFLPIKYEDLVLDRAATAGKIAEYIGETVNIDAFEISEKTNVPNGIMKALNGVRNIDTKSVGQWKKHPLRVWNEFTENKQMHDLMNILGYEQTPHWFFEHYREKLPITFT